MKKQGRRFRNLALVLLCVLYLVASVHSTIAASFTLRSVLMSDSLAGKTDVTYTLSFSGGTTAMVGSIRLQMCQNDPFPGSPCTIPSGFDLSHAQLVDQLGATGFSIKTGTAQNELIMTRTPAPSSGGLTTFTVAGVTNPTIGGTYYGRLETFASTDASGMSQDTGGLAISFVETDVSIKTYVPPFLEFCIGNLIENEDCATATGNYIDFGDFSTTKASTGQTKMLVATNAEYGYSIAVTGTTLTSGTNVIPPLTVGTVSKPGTSQFGMNLRANATPAAGEDPIGLGRGTPSADYNTPNQYKFASGDVIASYKGPDYRKVYTANYIVNIAKDQAPGVYVSTLTYIALATF